MTPHQGSWRSNVSEKVLSPPSAAVIKAPLSSLEERERIREAEKIIEEKLKEMTVSTSWLEDDNDDDFLLDPIITKPAINISSSIPLKTVNQVEESKPVEKVNPVEIATAKSKVNDNHLESPPPQAPQPQPSLSPPATSTSLIPTYERITVRLYKDSKPIHVQIKFNNNNKH